MRRRRRSKRESSKNNCSRVMLSSCRDSKIQRLEHTWTFSSISISSNNRQPTYKRFKRMLQNYRKKRKRQKQESQMRQLRKKLRRNDVIEKKEQKYY